MTKARALRVIRKVLMSPLWPGLLGVAGIECMGPEYRKYWSVFCVCCEKRGGLKGQGGSGGVQSRAFFNKSRAAGRPNCFRIPVPTSLFPFKASVFSLLFALMCTTLSLLFSFHLGSCDSGSGWLAWHRVAMSVGKQSFNRMPLSLWQSSSPMKPYQ